MARFNIYAPDGTTILAEGTPVWNGTYMKPASLTFRNISSPTPIDWQYGCKVDYTERAGIDSGIPQFYYLYTLPQVKKQTRSNRYGAAFEYDNVVFYDESKLLEYCPFRDLVTADNLVHFSSRSSFSTYEAVDGIARRIEASLLAQYPSMNWQVSVATTTMGASEETVALMAETREFSVDLVTCQGALEQIYQVWPGIGYVFYYETRNEVYNIIIGGAGTIGSVYDFLYGKGYGLKSITRTLGNDTSIINRIYPFGNTTNVPLRYYNGLSICNASSVDIPNLMIPTADWGTSTEDDSTLPDASKAYYEDTDSIARIGLRPSRVYFDGNNNLDNIYPTIKGMTVGDIWDWQSATGEEVDLPPSESDWAETDPLDEILSVTPDKSDTTVTDFDSGLEGEDDYNTLFKNTMNTYAGIDEYLPSASGSYTESSSTSSVSSLTLDSAVSEATLRVTLDDASIAAALSAPAYAYFVSATLSVAVSYTSGGSTYTFNQDVLNLTTRKDRFDYRGGADSFTLNLGAVDAGTITSVWTLTYTVYCAANPGNVSVSGRFYISASFGILNTLLPDFQVNIGPFGYDLTNLVATEGTVRLAMTSGDCAGREFTAKACVAEDNNSLTLTLERQLDESLSQYFPNASYPVAAGDTFVVLGIAMPELYISAASTRLATAAADYLTENAVEVWQYNPAIDDKFMIENSRLIVPGQYMNIIDPDVIEYDGTNEYDGYVYFDANTGKFFLANSNEGRIIVDGGGYYVSILVDSVTIDESAVLPAWSVTLRDRKKTINKI